MYAFLEPGQRVRHPDRPDWGIGQVQSVIGDRVTVNFEHAGKLLINAARIALETVSEEEAPAPLASSGDAGPNA
jgi:FKBP-type peptidyl-prolyl cis-trans isomerase 2